MSDLGDVWREIAAVHEQAGRLQREAVETRALASLADRDVSDVRGAIAAIRRAQNSLQETQLEQGRTLRDVSAMVGVLVNGQAALNGTVERHTEILNELSTGQSRLLARQDRLAAGHAELAGRMTAVEAGQAKLEQRQGDLEAGQARLLAGQAELAAGQAEILRRLPPQRN